jgi:hypothetical protein
VKIPHDRVTVNRIDSESRAACPERFVSWMFREKASAANTVFFECPVFLSGSGREIQGISILDF